MTYAVLVDNEIEEEGLEEVDALSLIEDVITECPDAIVTMVPEDTDDEMGEEEEEDEFEDDLEDEEDLEGE